MSNTVITNYTDLSGPCSKADSSVVVIVNKDGSLSVDEKLLGTLMGSDGAQGAVSVVRVGHEGRPDDATDSESDNDKIPHVTLSVDSYFDEPNSIIKYDSGAEMLQSFRIETRENSLLGFQNDHCYTPLTSPEQSSRERSDYGYDDPIIEIRQEPPPRPVASSKKITILDQKIIPRGRKAPGTGHGSLVLKGHDIFRKALPLEKSKQRRSEESSESSSQSSSGDSIQDRESDSDYNDPKDGGRGGSARKTKSKTKVSKSIHPSRSKVETKSASKGKPDGAKLNKTPKHDSVHDLNSAGNYKRATPKQTPRLLKKSKKTPVHAALLSDMTTLFSTPDVIRRVSDDSKTPINKVLDDKQKIGQKTKQRLSDKTKTFDPMPQIDDASLAQILQDTTPVANKSQPNNSLNSPSLVGPLSPTLDLLASLQPEEEGLTEDLLMHVAQLVESSENLQEVIDKQVLGKVDASGKALAGTQLAPGDNMYTPSKSAKIITQRKDPIEVVRRDGRVITLPPIEAPATRSSKRKTQGEPTRNVSDVLEPSDSPSMEPQTSEQMDEPNIQCIPIPTAIKQFQIRKIPPKKPDEILLENQEPVEHKLMVESQESWNSEDDPNRLWCICRQPHNNRFMICCDGCEDWFHGKCVNITKAMGQQMEEQGIEWRCPKCSKKARTPKTTPKPLLIPKTPDTEAMHSVTPTTSKQIPDPKIIKARSGCIVCRKPARASSIYCSDACILKHAQDSLGPQSPTKPGADGARPEKGKSDSRVIVFERKTGRCLAGPNAPTAENLKDWLQKNPTFEVVRPGTLSAINRPVAKKPEPKRIQTTLNFEKVPKKIGGQSVLKLQSATPHILTKSPSPLLVKSSVAQVPKSPLNPVAKGPMLQVVKSPVTPVREQQTRPFQSSPPTARSQHAMMIDPKPGTSNARPSTSQSEIRKPAARATASRSQSTKASPSPAASRRKEPHDQSKIKMDSVEPIRGNVRKALQEQMAIRMKEMTVNPFTPQELKVFATETEAELHDLFKDVGVKYKAKYRSLMFNIKDRKNLTLWEKICEKTITPKQLVRLSAEELASQELAQWRDKEAKHQLELIKKSELDLLAASKTYVLKTHKGEEVMQTKTGVSTELDPNVAVEDLVTALNDSSALEESTITDESLKEKTGDKSPERRSSKRKHKDLEPSSSRKSSRDTKPEPEIKKSKSSRKEADSRKEEERPSRRSDRSSRSGRNRSPSPKERSKKEVKEKSVERLRSSSRRNTRSSTHSRSKSQERDRSQSRRRSRSRDAKKRQRSSSRNRSKTTEKNKNRSKSQDSKKTRSSEAEAIERPKSAMLKDVHPEYDPHEPMITSAFSEEDLRKSGEEMYEEENLKGDLDFALEEYDPTKPFTIDTNVLPNYSSRRDKASEGESDQEPTSTVDNAAAIIWNGCINMVDVARFYVAAHDISGNGMDLEEELSTELDIVGRINPDMVWDYIGKMRRTGNKDIIVLRLEAANDEEKMQYIALYSYLSSRNRLGVVKVSNATSLKDFYIVPLSASSPLPPVLVPLEGPGLGEVKTHLLIAVVVRQLKKRVAAHIPKEVPPAKITRSSRKRSSTPPASADVNAIISSFSSPSVSTTKKDNKPVSTDDTEPYSPGSPTRDVAPPPPDTLRIKMEELNRQIEEQKQQIRKLTTVEPSAADDEAYSPSRPMTPPSSSTVTTSLADIALPSNLQEILATIKQRSGDTAATGDVDMRTCP